MSDKLIKREGAILPAGDFAQKVDEALKDRCRHAYKDKGDVVYPCVLPEGHADDHESATGSTMWRQRCTSMSGEGTQCRYQRDHLGTHTDGESLVWATDAIGMVGQIDTSGINAFEVLGEALKSSSAFQQALAQRLAQRAPIMQKVPLQKAREYQLTFGAVDIEPQQIVTLSVQPQVYFRAERLSVTEPEAFIVRNIFVGQRSQLPPGNGVSALLFASADNEVRFDTANPAMSIVLQVQNITDEIRRFDARLVGKAVL